MNERVANFRTSLNHSVSRDTVAIQLLACKLVYPDAETIVETPSLDRFGSDFIPSSTYEFTDVKYTDNYPHTKYWANPNNPELILERWSSVEDQKLGWSIDRTKITNRIIWQLSKDDGAHVYSAPHKSIVKVLEEYEGRWTYTPVPNKGSNKRYTTMICYVPVEELNHLMKLVIDDTVIYHGTWC